MRIVYTHGANASERSFAFIQQSIDNDRTHFCNYDSSTSTASNNIDRFIEELSYDDDELFLIGHSLGGIYNLYILDEYPERVKAGVTLATPYNGSEIATWARFMNPGYKLFRDITPESSFIEYSRDISINIPWTQVVTTVGSVPWIMGKNDGIVTRDSMMSRSDMQFIEIDRNHYEIVQSKRVVELITSRLEQLGNE